VRAEGTTVFNCDADGVWTLVGAEETPLLQTAVRDLAEGVCGAYAIEMISETADDLPGFGFEPATAVVTVTLTDGAKATIMLGNLTPGRDYYYMMVENDPALYMIYKVTGDRLNKTMEQLVDKTMVAVDPNVLTHVAIQTRGKKLIEAKIKTDEEVASMENDGYVQMSTLKMISPVQGKEMYLASLDTYIVQPLANITLGKMVCPATTENLALYGFNDPMFDLLIAGGNTEDASDFRFHLTIGDDADANGNTAYAVHEGIPFIFEVDTAVLKTMYSLTAFRLIDRFVSLVYIDTVDEIIVQSLDKNITHSMKVNGYLIPSDKEGVEPEKAIAPTVNGTEVQDEAFRNYYQILIGMSFDALLEEYTPSGDPALVLRYKLNNGRPDVVDTYYDYDSLFYAIVKGDMGAFLVSKQYVNTVLRSVDDLMAGLLDE